MKRLLIFVICSTIFLIGSSLFAAFPPEHYPTADHPRLWLTSERLAAVQASRQQGNQRWLRFQTLCDSLIDSDPGNDPWNLVESPQHYTAPLAFMYILTQDERYADRALQLMDITSTDLSRYGDPDHENFQYLGLTYDWLHDYSGMTEVRKAAYRQKMKTISDSFWNDDNVNASGTDSDQNLLTMTIHMIFGTAMYGDTDDALTLLDQAWLGWESGYCYSPNSGTSNRDFVRAALGGAYFTGYSYFSGTDSRGISDFWMSLKSACNYDIYLLEPDLKPFWANIIRSIIHFTEPTRSRIYANGSWQDPNILADQAWMRRLMTIAAYFADQANYGAEAALARGYAAAVDIGYYNDAFEELFYYTPGAAVQSPYTGALPQVRFADKPDFLLFRDNWGLSATWGIFNGNGSIPVDHQEPNHGGFTIWRGNDYLTCGARNYDSLANGDFFNTLSIENGCRFNDITCSGTAIFNSEKGASISRHREGNGSPLYAYGMLEADGQWNDNPDEYEAVANVSSYRRHFFWSDSYVIIFDRLRTKAAGWVKYRLRALAEPVINGNTVSQLSANGEHKLLQRTLEPEGITIQKVDEFQLWSSIEDWVVDPSERKWQSVIEIPSTANVNILNVIQIGPASMSDFDLFEHLTGNDNAGVRIGDWVVDFSASESRRNTVAYEVHNSASTMYHLVADMEAGQYELQVGGDSVSVITVKENDNTALFQVNADSSGTCTISLQRAATKLIYVDTANYCNGLAPCYGSIQSAVDEVTGTLNQVLVMKGIYAGGLQIENDISLVLSGGWNDSYTTPDGTSSLSGGLTIDNGAVEIDNIILE